MYYYRYGAYQYRFKSTTIILLLYIVSDDSLIIAPCADNECTINWIAGQNYSLACSLIHMIHNSATFTWMGQHNIHQGRILNFMNLQFSQGGTYTCQVNISSVILMKSATIEVHRKFNQLLST